MESVKLFNSN